ncbi:MAG: PEP-CTERM sorting domain-containing protein [Nitrosospira sp.]|nr:PEP-CTERM sorting domain-containing protein [Nitrosospira sp.]
MWVIPGFGRQPLQLYVGTRHRRKHVSDAGIANGSLGGPISVSSVSAIPEPETYAMLLAGLGMIGAMVRRRTASTNR